MTCRVRGLRSPRAPGPALQGPTHRSAPRRRRATRTLAAPERLVATTPPAADPAAGAACRARWRASARCGVGAWRPSPATMTDLRGADEGHVRTGRRVLPDERLEVVRCQRSREEEALTQAALAIHECLRLLGSLDALGDRLHVQVAAQ